VAGEPQKETEDWKIQSRYDSILSETNLPWCWACGRGERDKPSWWYAPWLVERAHICNKPRLEDRRMVVLLCSACHKTQHGERFPQWALPRLTLPNMLWLKQERDAEFWDVAKLQSCAVQLLPEPIPPAAGFLSEYERRRGMAWRMLTGER
jgi:hypothetical protein